MSFQMQATDLVAPLELRDFSKSLGWVMRPEGLNDRLYVLEHAGFPRRQLVFPMDASAPDYPESARHTIEKLSELLGERPDAVLHRAQSVRDDVIRLRIYQAAQGDGSSVPPSVASAMINGAQQLLKAAACTVIKPRLHHPRLHTSESQSMIEKCRFGQTEAGSLIFRIACPIFAMAGQGTLEFGSADPPFVRKVTQTLFEGVATLIRAIETDTETELVKNTQASGTPVISTNFCEALTNLHDDRLDNALDLTVDWSAALPLPPQGPLRLQRDYFARIEEVGRGLRPSEGQDKENYIGTVERLDGEMGDEGRRAGDVVLALLLPEGETVQARVTLNADQYAQADRAHMTEGAYVEVTGRLKPGRQPRRLTDLSYFGPVGKQA